MAKRQRADIKAALAAASGVDSDERPKEEFKVQKTEAAAKDEVVIERGGESRRKKKTEDSKGHQRTSTGYVKSDGQEVVRLTLHMSAEQKRRFKIKMITSGFDNPSSYVIDSLNLDDRE